MARLAVCVALVTAIYLAILGSLEPADLVLGATIAAGLLLALGQPGPAPRGAPPTLSRFLHFPRWAGTILASVGAGAWRVVRAILMRGQPASAIVVVPIGDRSKEGVAVTALAAAISPGELVTDVDWDEGTIAVHVLEPGEIDPEAVRRRYRDEYERQRRVFP